MGGYVADTGRILALVDRAKSIGRRIEQRIFEVEREVAALEVGWEGAAALAHRAEHAVLHRELSDMKAALSELEARTRGAHDRYLANIDHNRQMWP